MPEIKIPKRIKIGGFNYKVRTDKRTSTELVADNKWGSHRSISREILIDATASSQQVNSSFIHECIHAIDAVYTNNCLSESQNTSPSNGLHQILEQMKVRFVK